MIFFLSIGIRFILNFTRAECSKRVHETNLTIFEDFTKLTFLINLKTVMKMRQNYTNANVQIQMHGAMQCE